MHDLHRSINCACLHTSKIYQFLTVKAEFTNRALSFYEATQHVQNEDMQCRQKQREKALDCRKVYDHM